MASVVEEYDKEKNKFILNIMIIFDINILSIIIVNMQAKSW